MQRFISMCACALVLAAGLCPQTQASVPLLIPHQGRLLDSNDEPVTGVVPITFRLFDSSEDGVAIWTESHPAVVVTDGLFDAKLGSITPLTLDILSPPVSGSSGVAVERYLEVVVDGTTLSPRLRMGTTPYAMASGRVSGDMETAPGEMRLYGMSGSTTATIRSSMSPGSEGSALELVDSTGSGMTSYTVIARFSDGTTSDMTADVDGDGHPEASLTAQATLTDGSSRDMTADANSDGVPESSIREKTTYSGSLSTLQGRSGSTTGTIRMMASPDSVVDVRDCDDDDDGLAEGRVVVRVRPSDGGGTGAASVEVSADRFANGPRQSVSLDGSFSRSSVRCATDLDVDGSPDVVVRSSTDADSAGLVMLHKGGPGHITLRSGMSGSTTGTIRMMAAPDSTGEVLGHDSDGDGHAEGKITVTVRDQFGNCQLAADTDDDGVADNDVDFTADATGARSALEHRSGSTTGTIRMAATGGGGLILPSTELAQEMDADADGTSEKYYILGCTHGKVSSVLASDDNDDGVADNDIEMTADATGAAARLGGMSGSTTGTIRMQATSDSVGNYLDLDDDGDGFAERTIRVTLRDQAGNVSVAADVDDDGVADNDVVMTADATGARSLIEHRSGSTTGTIRMAADSGGVIDYLDWDDDGDGVAERYLLRAGMPLRATDLVAADLDGDGQSDYSVETFCDATKSSIRVEGDLTVGSGSLDFIVGNDAPSISMDQAGELRFLVRPDSGVQLYDDLGAKTCDIGTDGRISASTSLTIGGATASHFIDVAGGAYCDGTDWVSVSDVASKENFEAVDGEELLDRIADLKITRWNYKGRPGVEHIGPMAQDFQAAFGVGADDKTISSIDPSGIALAAIQELQKQNRELAGQNEELREQLERLSRKVDALVSTR